MQKHRFQPQIDEAERLLEAARAEYLAALAELRQNEATAYRQRTVSSIRIVQAQRTEASRLYGIVDQRAQAVIRWTRGIPIGQFYEVKREHRPAQPVYEDVLGPQ